jgi:hypothetical protein
MTQEDHTIIRVGEDKIGIRGMKGAIEEMAQFHGDKTDEEIGLALLEKLSQRNFIAGSAKDEYCKAVVREFRKFLGQKHKEETADHLTVVVLGPGCAQCDRLEQLLKQVLSELELGVSVLLWSNFFASREDLLC